jgi:hypothetical protein
MALSKRGEIYYYEFELYGRRYKKSTRCKNKEDAKAIEAAARLRVVDERAGIHTAKPQAPTLKASGCTFMNWVNQTFESQRTREYYRQNFDKLLQFPSMSEAPMNHSSRHSSSGHWLT